MNVLNDIKNQLWVSKYRPEKLKNVILPQQTKDKIKDIIETQQIPNMLFSGPPGTGKTTLVNVILNELNVDKSDILELNASDVNSIEAVRSLIKPFAQSTSTNNELPLRFIFLDECLDENEEIRIGTIDDWKPIKLKDLENGTEYPIVSFNMENGELYNDIGFIVSEKEDDIYEIELEDGTIIKTNKKHPFIIENNNGTYQQLSIEDGLSENDEIIFVK